MKRTPTPTAPPLTSGMTEGARVAAAAVQNEVYAQTILDSLAQHGPSTLKQILSRTDLAVSHANRALERLTHTGRAYNSPQAHNGAAIWYPLEHGLPDRPAALTADARIIRDWLTGRTDTVPFMAPALGMSRERIVEGLARLRALNLLDYRGVGALPLFTLRAVTARRAS